MDELELEFELDPQLAADCVVLGDFPLCRLLLMNDCQYPWFILVPRRAGVTEVYHLSEEDQRQLAHESSYLSENLADIFAARKMNVAALGNVVSQLHVHHVVRYESDASWPAPIWGKHPAVAYDEETLATVQQKVNALIEDQVHRVA